MKIDITKIKKGTSEVVSIVQEFNLYIIYSEFIELLLKGFYIRFCVLIFLNLMQELQTQKRTQ